MWAKDTEKAGAERERALSLSAAQTQSPWDRTKENSEEMTFLVFCMDYQMKFLDHSLTVDSYQPKNVRIVKVGKGR